MPNSPFKKLAKDAAGSVLGGAGAAGGGAAVGGEGRPGVLKKAGWEQGAAKVSRTQPVQAEDGERL